MEESEILPFVPQDAPVETRKADTNIPGDRDEETTRVPIPDKAHFMGFAENEVVEKADAWRAKGMPELADAVLTLRDKKAEEAKEDYERSLMEREGREIARDRALRILKNDVAPAIYDTGVPEKPIILEKISEIDYDNPRSLKLYIGDELAKVLGANMKDPPEITRFSDEQVDKYARLQEPGDEDEFSTAVGLHKTGDPQERKIRALMFVISRRKTGIADNVFLEEISSNHKDENGSKLYRLIKIDPAPGSQSARPQEIPQTT